MEKILHDDSLQDESNKQLERWAIILWPGDWTGNAALLHALVWISHHSLPFLMASLEDSDCSLPMEELIALRSKEVKELIMTLKEIPREPIIIPPTKTFNKHHHKQHKASSHYTSQVPSTGKKSFHNRKK